MVRGVSLGTLRWAQAWRASEASALNGAGSRP